MKQTIQTTTCIVGLSALIGIAFWIAGVPDLEEDHSRVKLLVRSIVTFPLFWAGISTLVMAPMIWMKRAKLAATDKKFGRVVSIGVQMPALLFLLAQILIPLKLYGVLGVDTMDTIFFFFLIAFFIGIGNYLPTVPYQHRIGFRTQATLCSPVVWERTHRFLGRGLILTGLISLPMPLLLDAGVATWVLVGFVAATKAITWLHARRLADRLQMVNEAN